MLNSVWTSHNKIMLGCALALAGIVASPATLADSTGYTGIFGGGPIYKNPSRTISELGPSGFNEVIVWSVEVLANGDLNFNGEFPLVSNGQYIGAQTYPAFASTLASLKSAGVKRITFSIGSSNIGDFQHIKALVNSTGAGGGTGSQSTLYRNFQALKAAIPSIDAIDLDDENSYDTASTVSFSVMLGKLGYHVMPDPYANPSYWKNVVAQVNQQRPGTIDGVHLQTYAGGSGNNPCSGWDFGGIPVYPGLADTSVSGGVSVPGAQSTVASWESQCGITGAFLWLYDDVAGKTYNGQTLPAAYAGAINTGLTPLD
ncbi:hypothetical protein HBF26_12425 [Luteibacter jiangsuensis]|uniref:Glycosyl hydrolase family 18 (Putative chitinase) n=1 Tax=Luteibacter jiangsuensis TaxID=637577 RepID=A0ABX0Q5U3_9GAMM|nr:hypothetical protein [Luteibacter jiangsuensis]NID05696.1 hypothetical protein [Luteibacter jiangsuensis]